MRQAVLSLTLTPVHVPLPQQEFVHDESSGEMVASPSGRISIYGSMGPAPSGGSLQSGRAKGGVGATRQRHAASAATDNGRRGSGASAGSAQQRAAAASGSGSASQVLLAHPAGQDQSV